MGLFTFDELFLPLIQSVMKITYEFSICYRIISPDFQYLQIIYEKNYTQIRNLFHCFC